MSAPAVPDIRQVISILPSLTPLIVELLKWFNTDVLKRADLPRPIKWVISSLVAAALAALGAQVGDPTVAVASGITGLVAGNTAYRIAREKAPHA